jgi:peroxiredoxin family protein
MALRFTAVLTAILLLSAPTAGAEDDPAEKKVELKKGDKIIFFGDSLTELAGKEEPKKFVTKGYVRIFRDAIQDKHKDKGIEVDWVATGGHTVPDLLKRVDKDVIAKKPTIVVIQIGVNDASAGVTPELFKSQLEELIGKLQQGGAQVIQCTCTCRIEGYKDNISLDADGSGINNFGVQLLLDGFLKHSPAPKSRVMGGIEIAPENPEFSGFIFKIFPVFIGLLQ